QYEKVKVAILDQTGISPETYRQRLRREKYPPGARPWAVAQKVRDLCWRWLEPERHTSCQVAEAVVLEQFLRILPTGGKEWVQRHTPKTLTEATSLVEDFMAVEPEERGGLKTRTSGGGDRPPEGVALRTSGGGPRLPAWHSWSLPNPKTRGPSGACLPQDQEEPAGDSSLPQGTLPTEGNRDRCYQCGQRGHFRRECPYMDCNYGQVLMADRRARKDRPSKTVIPVRVEGTLTLARVDSGCSQTVIRVGLVEDSLPTGAPIQVQCIHGDVKSYPTVWVQLEVAQQKVRCLVGVAP
ncbi:zinc finger and SCAN domain containing 29, partial [Chelydra serpentina]